MPATVPHAADNASGGPTSLILSIA
jgi:hypothetical protein